MAAGSVEEDLINVLQVRKCAFIVLSLKDTDMTMIELGKVK